MKNKSKLIGFYFVFFLCLISPLCFTPLSFAQSQDPARALYDQGKYQEALDLFFKSPLLNAADYYNVGNCYYKLGKFGQALGYYEKALSLAPSNEDIRYNIDLTQKNLQKSGALPKDRALWSGYIVPLSRSLPAEFVDLLLLLSTLAIAILALRAKRKSLRLPELIKHPIFLMTLGIWALIGGLATTVALGQKTKLAAVTADLSVARSGPNVNFTELFKLPAGAKVELTGQSRDGWFQVRFSLNNIGWMLEKDLLAL